MIPDIAVIGAGAAGLATAIFTRRNFNRGGPSPRSANRSVLLLDGARRPGAKILVSGGSRFPVSIVAFNKEGKIPTIYSWSLGLQQQLFAFRAEPRPPRVAEAPSV